MNAAVETSINPTASAAIPPRAQWQEMLSSAPFASFV